MRIETNIPGLTDQLSVHLNNRVNFKFVKNMQNIQGFCLLVCIDI